MLEWLCFIFPISSDEQRGLNARGQFNGDRKKTRPQKNAAFRLKDNAPKREKRRLHLQANQE